MTISDEVGAASLARTILSDVFGYDDFRSSQAAVVAALHHEIAAQRVRRPGRAGRAEAVAVDIHGHLDRAALVDLVVAVVVLPVVALLG